ncbi:MAG TPA: hypothetical protein VLK83_10945 [Rhodanobacteraceae bacterium]|nr:hypothetical protein [Rhodanobacteraceae bacterium]
MLVVLRDLAIPGQRILALVEKLGDLAEQEETAAAARILVGVELAVER